MSAKITGQEISEYLQAKSRTATWLAKQIGVAPSTPTRWMKGKEIPDPAEKLLKMLIRGEVPADMISGHRAKSLEFTEREWSIIEMARTREGFKTASEWIVAKIRAYILGSNPRH